MPVKIVTDSTSDISPETAQELDIAVVPMYVRFGVQTYRDGVDIKLDEFYNRLEHSPIHPSTSQPTPADFAGVYSRLSSVSEGIISIHVSSKLSGTYNSALQGKHLARIKKEITVLDSSSVSMGLGMTALLAARMAKAGENLEKITEVVKQAINNTHLTGTFDTLKYLVIGGRIGKAKALVGSVLNVKPVLVMREGELHPVSNVRTRAKAIEKLIEFAKERLPIQELAVIYTTTPDEAEKLQSQLAAVNGTGSLSVARLGPALGVYGGPGMLGIALRSGPGRAKSEKEKSLIEKITKLQKPALHLPKIHMPHR